MALSLRTQFRGCLYSSLLERIDQKPGSRARRGGILAGDELTIGDRVNAPVLDLGKGRTKGHQCVLYKEGHHLRQSYFVFFAIGEPGHGLAFDERLAVGRFDMAKRAGRVTDDSEGFSSGQEGFQQLDRV